MKQILLCFVIILSLVIWNILLYRRLIEMTKLEEKNWIKVESNRATNKMLIWWIEHKIEKKEIVKYLNERGFFRISIYGMTDVGILLYKILKDTDIKIMCAVDRSRRILNLPFNIFKPDEFKENVDAIVVTSIYYYSEIYDVLRTKVGDNIPIIGLDEILFDLRSVI